MDPLTVEILAHTPTTYLPCQSCALVWQQVGLAGHTDAEQTTDVLPPDVMRDYRHLSAWIIALAKKHGEQVRIRIVDVASFAGFMASLRYGVRRYPALVIAGRDRFSPADFAAADVVIDRYLAARASTT
jgi:hypothetical protein